MQPRTRAVLAALNIPVWMGRGAVVQRARLSIWRDEAPLTDHQGRAKDVGAKIAQHALAEPVAAETIDRTSVEPAEVKRSEQRPRQALQPIALLSNPPLAEPVEAKPAEVQTTAEPLLRFSVQARLIGDWIVLVPDQALQDSAAQRLWDNITEAMQASAPQSFLWPLAEGARWQRMEGASAALAGFLYRLGKTQRVGLMGDLPDQVCPDRIERLPSLADLLVNPLQKRSLWRLLRS